MQNESNFHGLRNSKKILTLQVILNRHIIQSYLSYLYFNYSRPKALDKIVSHQDIIVVLRRFIQNGEVDLALILLNARLEAYNTHLYLI